MPGATIDHLVAFIIVLVAILLFVSLFSQNLQSAILYQRNSQLATEASDLLDSISLSPGNPQNWCATNSTPTLFGLQDPTQEGYVISPFSLMRLNASNAGSPVWCNGAWYSNVTMASGGYLLVPFNRVVSYTTAARLLGVNGSYGFQLAMIPILNVSMSRIPISTNASALQIGVTVTGSGLPLAGASLNYYLITSTNGPKFPKVRILTSSNMQYTNATGSVVLRFPSVNATNCAYALIAYANLEGLYGVGYFVSPVMTNRIIPVVGSFDDGKGNAAILLAPPPSNALSFNATFLVLGNSVSSVVQMSIGNGTVNLPTVTGLVTGPNQYAPIQIPNKNQTGILVVTYNSTATNPGIALLPWGLGSLGGMLVYGSAIPSSSNKDWVTTDVRQVMVAGESYQFKIALWSLAGYQAQGPSGGTGT